MVKSQVAQMLFSTTIKQLRVLLLLVITVLVQVKEMMNQIILKLGQVSSSVQRIVACVTIDKAVERRQTFGMVDNSYVRLVNKETDQELARFNLKGDYSTDTAVIFAELVRTDNDWAFHAIGEGKQGNLNVIASLYQ